MTLATKITVVRLLLVPVFGYLAVIYGLQTRIGEPREIYRWSALAVFVTAAASDGIDGWIARRFDQCSELGAFLDPLADKALVLTAIIILTLFDWGPPGWRLPYWFSFLVIFRDTIILTGIRCLNARKLSVKIRPHWTGKVCTFSLFVVLGWVMLRPFPLTPAIPCAIASIFILWSLVEYIRTGMGILSAAPRPLSRP